MRTRNEPEMRRRSGRRLAGGFDGNLFAGIAKAATYEVDEQIVVRQQASVGLVVYRKEDDYVDMHAVGREKERGGDEES